MMASMDVDIHKTRLSKMSLMRSPAADRNKEPILEVLRDHIPPGVPLTALEIASGTGQHAIYFAERLSQITWQPSECSQDSIDSINGYISTTGLNNVLAPVWIDTTQPPTEWAGGTLADQKESYDIITCVNMLHISEWASSVGFFKGCGYYLKSGGSLFIYGPFAIDGTISPESNVRFDAMLKQQNSEWGLRDSRDIDKLAKENGLTFVKTIDMPANNKTLILKKV